MSLTTQRLRSALDTTADLLEGAGARPHALLVLQHGRTLAERRWAPWDRSEPCLVYSCSKTFTSAAVGLAVADGAFGYQDTLAGLWPEAAVDAGPRARRIRVCDALAMATGHSDQQAEDLAAALAWDRRPDGLPTARAFLAAEPAAEPGTAFAYNNLATWMLSRIVARTTGRDILDLLGDRVLAPIGNPIPPATRDQEGIPLGFSGLHLRPAELARFAQLLLDDGVHQGRRLLPVEWMAGHRSRHIDTVGGPDWSQGYGWQVWMSRHGYRLDGAFGQFALILPEADAVVVSTNNTDDTQPILEAIWEGLLPVLTDGAGQGPDGQTDRATRAIAPAEGSFDPTRRAEAVDAAGQTLAVTPDNGSWTLAWRGDDAEARLRVGSGEWAHTHLALPRGELEVAATAGWTGDVLTVDLAVVTTPHTLRLRFGPEGLAESWDTEPLNAGGLLGQARPAGTSR